MLFLASTSEDRPRRLADSGDIKLSFKTKPSELVAVPPKPEKAPILPPDKQIVEARQTKTAPPEEPKFLGAQDHRTDKETKVSSKVLRAKAQDPAKLAGAQKKKKSSQKKLVKARPSPAKKEAKASKKTQKPGTTEKLDDILGKGLNYENLLAFSAEQLEGEEVNRGYLDYLDDSIEDGSAIDINTREYRYIGYFTGLRKAIELVWSYPSEAVRRGLRGNVKLKFIIQEDGEVSKVSVLESSGHMVLDNAIVQAINDASPFSPLPPGFKKDQLVIKGNFVYTLHFSAQR